MFILSEALDEQLKTLWFSPFQTDDMEADLDMVSALSELRDLYTAKDEIKISDCQVVFALNRSGCMCR